jgi:TolA-binding protein
VIVSLDTAQVKVQAHPVRPVITGGDTEQRLMQLEKRLAELEGELADLNTRRAEESEARQAETAQEKAERMTEDQRIRDRMANLAGGGLKLQAWGVVCLLLGTILTAFW